jgi:hypothetical protein
MPRSGTHITAEQRLPSEPAYIGLVGNAAPTLTEDDSAAIDMRDARVGVVVWAPSVCQPATARDRWGSRAGAGDDDQRDTHIRLGDDE